MNFEGGGGAGCFSYQCWAGIKNGIKYPSSSSLGIRVDNHGYTKSNTRFLYIIVILKFFFKKVKWPPIKPAVLSMKPRGSLK
jgi:hypothetical protein